MRLATRRGASFVPPRLRERSDNGDGDSDRTIALRIRVFA